MEKYNEVLERAKEAYKHCATDAEKKRLEFIFPELEENENDDEGIRKDLIEFVKQYGDNFYGQFSKASAISWLEKQGEQQHTNSKEDNTNEETNAPTEYGKYVNECLDEASKHFFSEGEDKYSVADLFYAGVRCGKSCSEKQGEPKSVWSEDDKDTLDWICGIINRTKQLELITQEEETFLEKWLDKWLNHSLELKEQDKKMLDSLITIFDTQYLNLVYYTKNGLISGIEIVDWLKSLKQEEHKSVWSEDDEAILKAIIQDIQERHHDAMWGIDTSKTAAVSTEFIIKFLKSLSPQSHWKPSEEQMQTLHSKLIEGSVIYPDDVRVFTTLYEDLLKL